jgi:hypothetical protein
VKEKKMLSKVVCNFNISENNIISVKLAKVLQYSSKNVITTDKNLSQTEEELQATTPQTSD